MALLSVVILSALCQHSFGVPKYVFYNTTISSFIADETCLNITGTHLASIHSKEDNADAQALCQPQITDHRQACWIGLHDFHKEAGSSANGFIWYDGTALDYHNWRPGEPNEYYKANGGEDLVSLIADTGQWNDELNGRELRLICWNPEYTKDPTNAPTISPTYNPSYATAPPTTNPTTVPTNSPTFPTSAPTDYPTAVPTIEPTTATLVPTTNPSAAPTNSPTLLPTSTPTYYPTNAPTLAPTVATLEPTTNPTNIPTKSTTASQTVVPTLAPSRRPTQDMEVKEETTDVMVTAHGGGKVAPKTKDAFVERNSRTIIFVLSVLLFCTCVVVVLLCYAERRKTRGSKKSGLKQPLLGQTDEYPALPQTQSTILIGEYGAESVELGAVRWIDHRLSSIVDNTASIGSSDENEDSDGEVLYNTEENRTTDMGTSGNTKGHENVNKEKRADENDDGDSSSDGLYDYHGKTEDGNQCEYVLE
eukprot:803400_1